MSTMAARNRTYKVLLHAYLEEIRVMKPSDVEKRHRMFEIWESCYGDLPPERKPRRSPRKEDNK